VKLTVLLDNNTLIDRYLLGEPAVCYLLEDDGRKILFDVGYSDAFLTNARRLSIDLLDVDFVVLSHGHLDHTWGLVPFVRHQAEARAQGRRVPKPTLVAHPLALSSRRCAEFPEAGSLLSKDGLSVHFDLELSREPVGLTEHVTFLGEIPRANAFEAGSPMGRITVNGIEQDDFVTDDSALAYKSSAGLVIITGCSHAGICSIVERAREVCGEDRIRDIVGGLHLLDPAEEQLEGTVAYMRSVRPAALHPCHCTDLRSKIALSRVVEVKEVGAGLTLEY
jgi:7,8-dihydropterin-6-yl-methyl-4-(beta-D-ribofuranosyl)aminobenzene 5'-phosphate synthase